MKNEDVPRVLERFRKHDLNVLEKLINVINSNETYWKSDGQLIIINKKEEDVSFVCQCNNPFFKVIEKKSQDELLKEGFMKISFEEMWSMILGCEMEPNSSIRKAVSEFLLEWERYFH